MNAEVQPELSTIGMFCNSGCTVRHCTETSMGHLVKKALARPADGDGLAESWPEGRESGTCGAQAGGAWPGPGGPGGSSCCAACHAGW